jgi:hypothetical protein
MKFKVFLISCFFCCFYGQLFAQEAAKPKTTSFKIQLDYLSDYIYNGRADSVKYPYQITTASVNFANGMYVNFGADYLLTQGEKRFDFFQLDLGYEFDINKKWTGSVYGTKFFYSSQSALLNGNISTDLGGTLSYDAGFVELSNTLDVFFASKADIQYNIGFEKSFSSEKEDTKFSFTPGLYGNFSSLNYYESEVTRRLKPKNAPIKNPAALNVISTTTANQQGVRFMSMELSFPISYETKSFGFNIYPAYAIPYNAITTTTTVKNIANNNIINKVNSTPYSETHLQNRWYVQAGVFLKF